MRHNKIGRRVRSALLLITFVLTGCNLQNPQPGVLISSAIPTGAATAVPTADPSPTATVAPATPTMTPIPPVSIWLPPYLPAALQRSIQLAPGVAEAASPEDAAFVLEVGGQQPFSQWVYALVAPFPTITDEVSEQELRDAWGGSAPGAFADRPLLMDESTLDIIMAMWGQPADGAIEVLTGEDLLDYAWANQPSWAIVPFEALEPRWKVLAVDGVSPIDQKFDPGTYPLNVGFALTPNPDLEGSTAGENSLQALLQVWQSTNRQPEKMTSVILTGVTALVRATAETMRRKGITHPSQDIREWLRSADITHVSNEIPFAADCPFPDAWQKELEFCSNPAYLELLQDIGTDVVELTGDHFGDWGPDAMRFTLDLYRQNDISYYGGGYDLEDARKPLLIEHNGNRLAFIGCNAKAPGYGTASENNPGAVYCDFDWLKTEIARLKSEGYLPIVTFQHIEYYTYVPQPRLIEDFRAAAEAGAVIVSGSQAHQPHGMEFYRDAFIHYGLGNLFFDQYHMGLPTGQGFLDRHVFYEGRHISTELLGIRFIDFARSRPMTPEERGELLQSVFEASLW